MTTDDRVVDVAVTANAVGGLVAEESATAVWTGDDWLGPTDRQEPCAGLTVVRREYFDAGHW